ncbi:MAG TPA: bifunctional 5,10-methylenetetrahydrofolate dehydrogenase/5,10-methenyltetrahydrofolate cyclohydrolase [Candidatus Olsenella pullicola]|nr:bifunctional 5,10-methylenetetrahydrofolate dehydrogenase/5,10-methenyltetrahydrofolate cyclohydrolase [Candidatus Olsenella pullicola]
MALLLKGAPAAAALTERAAARSASLTECGVVPTLAIVRVGERSDDLAYERAAEKRAAACGVAVRRVALPASCEQSELNAALKALGAQDEVHGILLFRPLPAHLDEGSAATCIPAEKDVDCAAPLGLLATLSGQGVGFAPCTAEAVLALLDHYEVPLDGANVTVIGRSLVIGRPVAALLLARNATVTTCHTHTRDLAAACRGADVIVAAAGAPGTVGAACVRPNQVVVDVGTTWDAAAGRLRGDVDAEAVAPIVQAISPVPGGVGSLTTAILVSHVVTVAERTCA